MVKVVKKSFACFTQFCLNYHQLSCLLCSVARTLNDRPISLFRAQNLNSPLNIVTPRSLMFIGAKTVNKFYLMNTTFNQGAGDISQTMKILKTHSSKILELYAKYLVQSYHKRVDSSCKSLELKNFKVNSPVLFNQKRTGVRYSYKLFNFGVIQEIKTHRNSPYPRTLLIRCMERGVIVLKAVRPEDCMLVNTQGDIGLISSSDIINLEI